MAYSNINDENFKNITKFNLDIGLSKKEKQNLNLEYTRKNILNKRYAGSGLDFPKKIPKYNEEDVKHITKKYFTIDTDDLQLEEELQRDFINSRKAKLEEQKRAKEDLLKVKEIKELNDAGIVLPEGISYFSEEGRAYIRSEASRHPKGVEEYIKDKMKAKEEKRIIEEEKKIAEILDRFIEKMIKEDNDPNFINQRVSKTIDEIFDNNANTAILEPNIKETAKRQLEAEVKEKIVEGKKNAGGFGAGGVKMTLKPRSEVIFDDDRFIDYAYDLKQNKKLSPIGVSLTKENSGNKKVFSVVGFDILPNGLYAFKTINPTSFNTMNRENIVLETFSSKKKYLEYFNSL